jgi:hypothetical protein
MEFKKLSFFQKIALKIGNKRAYQDYKILKLLHEAPPIDLEFNFKGEVHFKHSGNAGDVIYALPSLYAIAKQQPFHIHLNAGVEIVYAKNVYHHAGKVLLNEKTISLLQPLLFYQQQIKCCDLYKSQRVDVDMDLFRKFPLFKGNGNIARWYFYIFGIQADLSVPWLQAPKNDQFKNNIIIARSYRYRNPGINFSFLKKYPSLVFLGLLEEYEDMKVMLPQIVYYPVRDFLDMAAVINSCRLFIGNQSFPFSIAEALKVKRILEVCYFCPNVNVEGKNGYDFCYQPQFEKIVDRVLTLESI